MSYNPDRIREYFDSYGEDEWNRLVSSPKNMMSLQIHQHYLKKYVQKNDRILEIGAGSGRYSIFMANLGAYILVSDLSPVQLEISREKIHEQMLTDQILGYQLLDITDLSTIEEESYDMLVSIGGPLSYVFDQRAKALNEILRVTKKNGFIMLGVMSLYGSLQRVTRAFIPDLIDGIQDVRSVLETGDDPGYLAFEGHHAHLYTYKEIREFLEGFDVELLEITATSYLTAQRTDVLYDLIHHPEAWKQLFEMELEICKEMVDGGSHMLVVLRKC
ncbi:MAG: class I SAM-dependent methyltransferase [Candidatus Heimdallarchaeota archaeon]|nr:class I SAM-dependent methyltransferase [Candidatus Heimdallarchaeota archaeon]